MKYSAKLNNLTSLCVTKLDVLDSFSEIKVCDEYEIDNEIVQYKSRQLHKVEPKYKTFKGWEQSLGECQNYSELPKETREFLEFIEDYTKVKISLISNGPQRNDLIHR